MLAAHPEVRDLLESLAGLFDDTTMQRLSFEVDENKRRPRDVARQFLSEHALLAASKQSSPAGAPGARAVRSRA